MSLDKINYTILYGYIEEDDKKRKYIKNATDIFPNDLSTTTIKSLKVWFGPPTSKPGIKVFLGIEVTYINYQTSEKKTIEYQGPKIEGPDVETGELIMDSNDYLSHINIFCENFYITYIKFSTKKKFIQFGNLPEGKKEFESLK
jgi:hypothetical protein